LLKNNEIQLRLLEETDLERLANWKNVMYEYFYEYPIRKSNYTQKNWYEEHLKKGDILFIIEEFQPIQAKDLESIGTVGLTNIDWRNRTAEFGRFMIPDAKYRGKGYGRKAIGLVLEYGFDHLNLHRIYLDTLESNIAAIELYKKVGFVEEGRKKQHIYKNGKYFDLICMYILNMGQNDDRV